MPTQKKSKRAKAAAAKRKVLTPRSKVKVLERRRAAYAEKKKKAVGNVEIAALSAIKEANPTCHLQDLRFPTRRKRYGESPESSERRREDSRFRDSEKLPNESESQRMQRLEQNWLRTITNYQFQEANEYGSDNEEAVLSSSDELDANANQPKGVSSNEELEPNALLQSDIQSGTQESHQKNRGCYETPNTRERRLGKLRSLARKRRLHETPTTRERRLQNDRSRTKERQFRETPTTRKRRLENKRSHERKKRLIETPTTKANRLQYLRSRGRERRYEESPQSRERRLDGLRSRAREMRYEESPQSRERRLEDLRSRAREMRYEESPQSRERRLQDSAFRTKEKLANESESQRMQRLEQMWLRTITNLEYESPQSREQRLSAASLSARLGRVNITPETKRSRMEQHALLERHRIDSLSPQSKSQHLSRRRLLRDFHTFDFQNQIDQYMDYVCFVCTKRCFKNQRKMFTLNEAMKRNVLVTLPEAFDCCLRCSTALEKGKIPSVAFWNNMEVAPIPEELKCLTDLEIRLLSRITPFLKIVRLGGRFGQHGFKGQAVLFAQDLEEIAEQLPLSAEKSGIAIVAESLENVNYYKEYSVDIDRLSTALNWLIANNRLYANVTINFGQINDILTQICTIVNEQNANPNSNSDPRENRREPPGIAARRYQGFDSRYTQVGNGKFILRGTFHQGSDRFDPDSAGRQCTAIATAALAYANALPFGRWNTNDVDRVLMAGDLYYRISKQALQVYPKPNYLLPEELLKNLEVGKVSFEVEASTRDDTTVDGVINPSNPSELSPGQPTSLLEGLQHFFSQSFSDAIFTCKDYSFAVSCQDDKFWLFDSHSRGPKGYVAPARGTAMVMRFETLQSLAEHLLLMLKLQRELDVEYTVVYVYAVQKDNFTQMSQLRQDRSTQDSDNYRPELFEPEIQIDEMSLHYDDQGGIEVTAFLPINTNVPDMSDIFENVTDNSALPIHELKRKTAPPLSLLKERRAEELCWFMLFPDGRNGVNEEREIPITVLDYYQNRVMGSDTRFQRIDYLFYSLSAVELYRAKQNVSVCARLRQSGAQPQNLIQNVHLSMRNIRGTQSYWHKAYTELLAMVKNLGPPSWYITLSCNDLHWPDILKALLKADGQPDRNPEELTFPEKKRLVETYPVVLSKQFMFRFNAFLRVLKKDKEMLGAEVTDYWWRIEFQLRGSPHVHMVVWCDGLPDFDTPEGIEIIDRVATCHIPMDDPDLKDLVMKSQVHKHTHSCFKKKDQNSCRFQFPRPESKETKILGPDEALQQGGRFCVFKRKSEEKYINTYNPTILKLWQANIDVQPCGSAIGVAYYISKYVAKSEPVNVSKSISNALKNVEARGGDFGRKIFAVQAAILNHRQVSACECAFRLCHLRFRESSRKCVFVNTCIPEERYRMLRVDADHAEPFMNIFDRYTNRPHNLEEISLGEFAVRYEYVGASKYQQDDEEGDQDAYEEPVANVAPERFIKLLNNTGRMRIRTRPAILRTRYFSPTANPDAYYYGLLVAHVPFRDEAQLTEGFDNCKAAFYARRQLLRPLQRNQDAESFAAVEAEIQQAISKIVAERLLDDLAENGDDDGGNDANSALFDRPFFFRNDDDVVLEAWNPAGQEFDDFVEEDVGMTDEDYERRISSCNITQKKLLNKILEKLREPEPGPDDTLDSLKVFVTGGAGSGKSFVLKLVVETIRRMSIGLLPGHKAVAVAAPTGVAARLVNGATLHSTFCLPVEKGKPGNLLPLSGDRLQRMRSKWRSIKWLVIDEISMVPYSTLRNIHLRLLEFKHSSQIFGGVNVLLFGDLMQLPPVSKTTGGAYCFRQPAHFSAEPHLWQLFSFCELSVNMRQHGDNTFIDVLNSLRVGQLTMEQLQVLDDRRIPLTGEFADGEAIRIFSTIKQVDEYNDIMSGKLGEKTILYKMKAIDKSMEGKNIGENPPENCVPKDPNKCGGFLQEIVLGIGSRIMLRRNINVSKGLINGAMGVVKAIVWPALRRNQLEEGELPDAVLIKFDDATIPHDANGVVKIERHAVTFDGLRGCGKIERTMLPIILCWAVTVHKLQGTTLNKAVVDLGQKLFAKGQAYVAISRVRSIDGLAISNLAPNKLLQNPHDENSLEELKRLRSLPTAI